MRENGILSWLLSDHLGSLTITADAAGTKTAERRYSAWGWPRYNWGTPPTTYRFTGQRQLGLGLYYYGARWYDPALGRFIQPDPIVPEPGNPLAYDRYAYALNNPLRYTDPTGHQGEPPWWDWIARRARQYWNQAQHWLAVNNPCNWTVDGCRVTPGNLFASRKRPDPPGQLLFSPEEAEQLQRIAQITDQAERVAELSSLFRYRPGEVRPGSYKYALKSEAERARIFADTYGLEVGDIDIAFDPNFREGGDALFKAAGEEYMGAVLAKDTIILGPNAFQSDEILGTTLFHELLERRRGELTHDEIYQLEHLWLEWYRSLNQ